jgi:molecular chaperone GrpE
MSEVLQSEKATTEISREQGKRVAHEKLRHAGRLRYRLRRAVYAGMDPAISPALVAGAEAEHGESSEHQERDATHAMERLHVAEKLAIAAQSEKNAARRRVAELERQLEELLEEKKREADAAQELRKAAELARAQVMRARQDLEQQRRRFERQSQEVRKTAEENLLRDLFPVLDNFTYALDTTLQGTDSEAISQGVGMIHRELMNVLQQSGLEQVFPLNQPFDPQLHEAASTISRGGMPNNHVVQVLRPGYVLRGKALRPAMVVVNKTSEIESPTPPGQIPAVPAPRKETQERTPLDRAWRFLETRDEE